METPKNEVVLSYAPGTSERDQLQSKLKSLTSERIEIPCIIGGKEIRTGKIKPIVMPHRHRHVLANAHFAGEKELKEAASAALRAKTDWENLAPKDRIHIFQNTANLLAGEYRDLINGSTMLGQSKNAYQAEIDAACELIDFFRFNAYFYETLLAIQPISSSGVQNSMEYRSLDGFVLAITPFNFTSIAGNLPTVPTLFGNTAIWKPSDTQLYSAYFTMKLLEKAGFPPGVINFVPADGPLTSQVIVKDPDLGGLHFTGSTKTFQGIWKQVGQDISSYRSYPRLVGETGGKDFIFVHQSSDPIEVSVALLRGAFEYQGQKCSAASRAYVPKSLWPKIKEHLISELKTVTLGEPTDFSHFMNAVIDERAFKKITGYIERAKKSPDSKVISGGGSSSQEGYFIEPTVIETSNPKSESMVEEIFGPVLTVFPYEDSELDQAIESCATVSPYALTGAIFSKDKAVTERLTREFRHAAGNFYINDKPTGAVVGQQPFGGGKASGTNDKAGSLLNLIRWTSPRTIKLTLEPQRDYRYPFLAR